MNKDIEKMQLGSSKTERAFFGEPEERPHTKITHEPQPKRVVPNKLERVQKMAEAESQRMAEAEAKVQAWFDAGMQPAEREEALKKLIEVLERSYEEMEPADGETVEQTNRRTEEALQELNAAKAELSVLQKRLEELALPSIPDKNVAPIETQDASLAIHDSDQEDPDQPLGRQSGEASFVPLKNRNQFGGSSGQVDLRTAAKSASTDATKMDTKPAAEPSGGWFSKIKSWFTPKPASAPLEERRQAVSQKMKEFYSEIGLTRQPKAGFDQEAYNAKAQNYAERVRQREAREARLAEENRARAKAEAEKNKAA